MKINFGSGTDYKEGWVNVEFNKDFKAEVYHDLNKTPYPFKDNSADVILAKRVLTQLNSMKAIMPEIVRILKPGGKLIIIDHYYKEHYKKPNVHTVYQFRENSFEDYKKLKLVKLKKLRYRFRKWRVHSLRYEFVKRKD